MTIQELQQDIAQLEARQAELTRGIEATRAELSQAQTDLIEGKDGAGERATTLQARLTAHEGAVQALGRRLTAQRLALEEAQEAAEIARVRAAMEAEARKADKARDAMQTHYEALQEAFEQAVAGIAEAGRALDQAQRVHRKLATSLPEDTEPLAAYAVPPLGRYGVHVGMAVQGALTDQAREEWRQKQKRPAAA